jgi:hypothetical protein
MVVFQVLLYFVKYLEHHGWTIIFNKDDIVIMWHLHVQFAFFGGTTFGRRLEHTVS